MKYDKLATIVCLTYNQFPYIRQCLDGLVKQKVNFPFEIIVHDDASTDGTTSIIMEYAQNYPDIVVPIIQEENQYSQLGDVILERFVFPKCRGKYIAICEGDDYWIDTLKMQKQVDFLESHPDYGLAGSYNYLLFEDGTMREDPYDYLPQPIIEGCWDLYDNLFDYAKFGPVTRTVTMCFRTSILKPYFKYDGLGGDIVMQSVLAHDSKVARLRDYTAVYRVGTGVSGRKNFDSELRFAYWTFRCRMLQKKIFPADCVWDTNELEDAITYVKLKHAIYGLDFNGVRNQRSLIRSDKYRKKKYYKLSKNNLLCFAIGIAYKIGLIK